MKSIVSHSLDQTQDFARDLLSSLERGEKAVVVALSGDLGSGKTAFSKEAGSLLGIPREEITSPTFVIMKIFDIDSDKRFKKFVHIDAYRLESGGELESLGWDEIVADPNNLIFIEWPEMVKGIIPESALRLRFEALDEDTRSISIQ